MSRFALLLFLWFLSPSLSAQLTLKAGDEAPRITPTEYLMNGLKKSDLKGKFLLLTLCKTWDLPCFYNLPHLDSLRTAFSNDDLAYLVLFRGKTEMALKETEGKSFGVSLATDLYGNTQISYGDGATGLVGWPLTFLIDDENIVRWQGGSDDLTVEALTRFINRDHPVIDPAEKYVPLDPEDFLFEAMTPEDLIKLHEQDSVASFVRAWDGSAGIEVYSTSFYSHAFGLLEIVTLEDVYQALFPDKRVNIPGDLMERKYIVAFVERSPDRESAERLETGILADLGLQASIALLPAKHYSLDIIDQDKLEAPRPVRRTNAPPKGLPDHGSTSDRDLHNFEIRHYDLAGLAQILNKYSPDRWNYPGNNRKKYNFILDVSSTKALLKSLRQHGIGATGKAGTVEEVTLERMR